MGLDQQISDEQILRKLGYKQALNRSWGALTACAITISAMSVLTSITASFSTGLTYGGPVVCVWGWIVVSAFMLCVGLGMAELASAYPTSGGMYYWQYRLSGAHGGPFACWLTGWLNLLGQIAAVSAVAFLLSEYAAVGAFQNAFCFLWLIATMASLANTASGGPGIVFTPPQNLGIYGGCLVLVALVNSGGMQVLTLCTQAGAAVHLLGITVLAVIVPAMATQHQSAKFVFTHFETPEAYEEGIVNNINIVVLGLLLPAYSYTGMDGPAHMSEETEGASMAPAKAILTGIAVMFFGGLSLIIALLFSLESIPRVLDENSEAGGNAVAQILYDAANQRFGNPSVGVGLLVIIIMGVFFCCVATMTYVSRILFCYARDQAVPLSRLWIKVDKRTKSPIAAVWGITIAAFCLGLPMLGSYTAFSAILSLSTVSLIIVYVSPTTARISWGRKHFTPGPFNLGIWAYPIGAAATLFALFCAVIFSLPTAMPVDAENLNYAAMLFIGTVVISTVTFYFPKYGAYKWFKGPVHEVDDSASRSAGWGAKDGKGDGKEDVVISL